MVITAKNVDVDRINEMMLSMFPGTVREYYSYDKSEEDGTMHPLEYIHKLIPNGFPAHHLRLKKGVPIMLLRNIDAANGHCNGSRYVVTNLLNNAIEARALSGSNAGERILIPRIPLSTTESYPFNFTRRQYPIRLAFAITANKSQGQTLKKVRCYLDRLTGSTYLKEYDPTGWSVHAEAFLHPWTAVRCVLESH